MKSFSLKDVNISLSEMIPVETIPGSKKLSYRQNDKMVRTQYCLWISYRLVADKYDVSEIPPRLEGIKKARGRVSRPGITNQIDQKPLKRRVILK